MDHFLTEQQSFEEIMMEVARYQQLADKIQLDSCKVSLSIYIKVQNIIDLSINSVVISMLVTFRHFINVFFFLIETQVLI